ncbi:hypothetical protein [Streptomyces fradiae]|uniref:SCO2400 family protein n=1 Tax=Streptomyces fradiae TaxID=1906 RepID=UPI0035BE24B9
MDYCHLCRRHLNGALACAGCGRPAEDVRHDEPVPPDAGDVFELARDEHGARPAGRRAGAPGRAGARRAARAADGRRARRRRGRAVLLSVTGLVLTAGALSLASLALEDDRGAATSVRQVDLALPDALPDPSGSAGAADPGAVGSSPSASKAPNAPSVTGAPGAGEGPGTPTASASAGPGAVATGPAPGSGDRAGEGGVGAGKEGLKNPVSRKPTASASAPAATVPPTPPPGGEPEPPTVTTGGPDPSPPDASPDPEPPQEECERWLWWCF